MTHHSARHRVAFTKKKSKWFSFVGTLIILMTFVVKEELRDRWKETADSIDLAQYFYSIRKDTAHEEDYFVGLQDRLREIKNAVANRGNDNSPLVYNLDARLTDFDNSLDTNRIYLDNVKMLADKLPEKDVNRTTLEKLSERVDAVQTTIINADRTIPFRYKEKTWEAYTLEQKRKYKESLAAINVAGDDLGTLANDISHFVESLNKAADNARVRTERRKKYADWASAGLYCVGIILGFIGKMRGVEPTME